MEKVNTRTFDEIVKLAEDFVTQHKGKWDHAAWLEFLSTLQKKGFDITEDVKDYLGQVLEAMKSFYQATASMQGIEKALATVAKDSVQFVKERQAVWDHSDWEAFVSHIQKNTLRLSEETTAYLGGILESVKAFYHISSVPLSGAEKPAIAATASKPVAAKTRKRVEAPVAKAKDDLTAITGIGPALQKKLNDHGIHSFSQIAALSDQEIAGLEENVIKFSGRIKRDDWIGQARRFTEQAHRQ